MNYVKVMAILMMVLSGGCTLAVLPYMGVLAIVVGGFFFMLSLTIYVLACRDKGRRRDDMLESDDNQNAPPPPF